MTNATTTANPLAFQVGKTYTTGEARDYVWRFTVVSRSAKFITIEDVSHGPADGTTTRVGVTVHNDVEWAAPLGRYSQCPFIKADDSIAIVAASPDIATANPGDRVAHRTTNAEGSIGCIIDQLNPYDHEGPWAQVTFDDGLGCMVRTEDLRRI